jgi:hypothetical protein
MTGNANAAQQRRILRCNKSLIRTLLTGNGNRGSFSVMVPLNREGRADAKCRLLKDLRGRKDA